jgi:hypothetical protein
LKHYNITVVQLRQNVIVTLKFTDAANVKTNELHFAWGWKKGTRFLGK